MQMACRIIGSWCGEEGLSVNPKKTGMVLFKRRRNIQDLNVLALSSEPPRQAQEVKCSGVILDLKL